MNGLKIQIANVLALFQMNSFKFIEESMEILGTHVMCTATNPAIYPINQRLAEIPIYIGLSPFQ
jgi:hypothetical protein